MTVLAELLAGSLPNLSTLLDLVATDAVKPRDTVDHDMNTPRVTNRAALVESAVCTPTSLEAGNRVTKDLLIITLQHVVGKLVSASQAQTVLESIDLVVHPAIWALEYTQLIDGGRIEAVVEVAIDQTKSKSVEYSATLFAAEVGDDLEMKFYWEAQ
jgi:hypothetical protein